MDNPPDSADAIRPSHTDGTSTGVLLVDLNDRQRSAVLHGEEPLLIVAGAGTGKTATLAHRVAYKIATGTDPERILLLTFTRRAAGEMLRRVDGILRRLQIETGRAGPVPAGRPSTSGKVWAAPSMPRPPGCCDFTAV